MKHMIDNLSTDQKRFALYGSLSLLAVGIIIFFIYGFQYVNFGGDEYNMRFYERQRDDAMEDLGEAMNIQLAQYRAYAANSENPMFAQGVDILEAGHASLTTLAASYDVEIDPLEVDAATVDTDASESDVCAALLEDADALSNSLFSGVRASLGWSDVQASLNATKQAIDTELIPALDTCANE